jgi:hypothetical protein
MEAARLNALRLHADAEMLLQGDRPQNAAALAILAIEEIGKPALLAGRAAYLDRKADIGAPHATDQAILDRVDDITALMLGALGRAVAERRHTWLLHYGWFVDLVNELLDDLPGKPLDG